MTGFHKRKLARQEHAKKRAQLREKQQRLDTRREVPSLCHSRALLIATQHRRELAERAARNAAEVEKAYGMEIESGAAHEWRSLSGEPEEMEEEYEGEEQLATVTVVQDFDLPALLHGPPQTREPAEEDKEPGEPTRTRRRTPRVKYETKAARRVEHRKQRARRTEKAEWAGRKRK